MSFSTTKSRRDYVLFHLFRQFVPSPEITSQFEFIQSNQIASKHKICFKISDSDFKIENIFFHNDIPILFPIDQSKPLFTFEEGNLVFHQDILQSAFYLLSGQQEYENNKRDLWGRFPYKESIQYKLGIISKPIVNYYFEIIVDAIEIYCRYHSISFQKTSKEKSLSFCLTHDVDRINAYSFGEIANRLVQLIGLVPHQYPNRKIALKAFIKQFAGWLHINHAPDPYWNFDQMLEIEKQLEMVSAWYFLEKTKHKKDSKYHFSDFQIKTLIENIISKNCEIGLHGSIASVNDGNEIKESKNRLETISGKEIKGIRQHFLICNHPTTAVLQSNAGFRYDSTLGFAEHEGFRNSYCQPFRTYDFKNEIMLPLWEIPLTAMDTTFFHYKKDSFNEIEISVNNLITEIEKFNGVFVLLWHNNNFDEFEISGINDLYIRLLKSIKNRNARNVLPEDILTVY